MAEHGDGGHHPHECLTVESEDGQEGERNGKEEGHRYFSLNFRIGRAKRIECSD